MMEENQGGVALVSAEYDRQIAIAKRYPRSLTEFRQQAQQLATLTLEVARSCIYALPRQDRDGETKVIQGPSARFAEVLLSTWGNCAAGSRIVREDETYVYAQGVFIDLERNTRTWNEVSRRITTREGRRYSADMIAVTVNAAGSIARRNAILQGIPRAMWWDAYVAARGVVAGKAETFAHRRQETIETAQKMGLTLDRIYHALGVKGTADIGVEEYVALEGMLSAVREGEAEIDSAFPDPTGSAPPERPGRGMSGLRERVKRERAKKAGGATQDAPAGTSEAGGTSPPAPPTRSEPPRVIPDPTPRPGSQQVLGVQPMCSGPGCTNESDPRFDFGGAHYCEKCNSNIKASVARASA